MYFIRVSKTVNLQVTVHSIICMRCVWKPKKISESCDPWCSPIPCSLHSRELYSRFWAGSVEHDGLQWLAGGLLTIIWVCTVLSRHIPSLQYVLVPLVLQTTTAKPWNPVLLLYVLVFIFISTVIMRASLASSSNTGCSVTFQRQNSEI